MTTKKSNGTIFWAVASTIIGMLVGSLVTMFVMINQGLVR